MALKSKGSLFYRAKPNCFKFSVTSLHSHRQFEGTIVLYPHEYMVLADFYIFITLGGK